MGETKHTPLQLPEFLSLKGDPAHVCGKLAMHNRGRAEELFREAHQRLADAEALEMAARLLSAKAKGEIDAN